MAISTRTTVAGSKLHSVSTARAAIAGLCANLIGIGLGRFAYTPLIPALIGAGWFTPSLAVYLGAANLAGYLAGALLAWPLARRMQCSSVLRGMMLVVTTSFFACALQLPFAWFFVWRFAAGLAGGTIMVLAATTILPHVAAARRGLVGGLIFMGVGLGVAASGTLVPLLLGHGLVTTWSALGGLSALLTGVAWQGWPRTALVPIGGGGEAAPGRTSRGTLAVIIEYGLNAAGVVPHMVFLADFVARGLGRGIAAGAHVWLLYGLGAVAGPLLTGRVADRIGFGLALRLALLIQAIAVALPAITGQPVWLAISSVVVGGFTPGIVPLVFGRIQELAAADPEAQRRVWGRATVSFALFQAAAAYGYSFLFAHVAGAYALIYGIGAAALTVALVIDLGKKGEGLCPSTPSKAEPLKSIT